MSCRGQPSHSSLPVEPAAASQESVAMTLSRFHESSAPTETSQMFSLSTIYQAGVIVRSRCLSCDSPLPSSCAVASWPPHEYEEPPVLTGWGSMSSTSRSSSRGSVLALL